MLPLINFFLEQENTENNIESNADKIISTLSIHNRSRHPISFEQTNFDVSNPLNSCHFSLHFPVGIIQASNEGNISPAKETQWRSHHISNDGYDQFYFWSLASSFMLNRISESSTEKLTIPLQFNRHLQCKIHSFPVMLMFGGRVKYKEKKLQGEFLTRVINLAHTDELLKQAQA